jgi:hypothetical protein
MRKFESEMEEKKFGQMALIMKQESLWKLNLLKIPLIVPRLIILMYPLLFGQKFKAI